MKKVQVLGWFFLGASFLAYGNPYVVNSNCKVPVFTTSSTTLSYEPGAKGNECESLDTVLLPGEKINVLDVHARPVLPVEYMIGDRVLKGYIHADFLKNCTDKQSDEPLKATGLKHLLVKDCKAVFQQCLDEHVPYCWGGNSFKAISLPSDYQFKPKAGTDGAPFELRGFDCSGLLHFISGGILPHCTSDLKDQGKVLTKFECTKGYPDIVLKTKVKMLWDTDYILFICSAGNHVMVSYDGGFLEFRDIQKGCTYTSPKDTVKRLKELFAKARTAGDGEIYFIRWHPSYQD